MSSPDEPEWDLEPEYGRNGAPWVRQTFGRLLGFETEEEFRHDEHQDDE